MEKRTGNEKVERMGKNTANNKTKIIHTQRERDRAGEEKKKVKKKK